jgi:hypothetical protein
MGRGKMGKMGRAKWGKMGRAKWVIHDKDLSRENALFPALNGRDS